MPTRTLDHVPTKRYIYGYEEGAHNADATWDTVVTKTNGTLVTGIGISWGALQQTSTPSIATYQAVRADLWFPGFILPDGATLDSLDMVFKPKTETLYSALGGHLATSNEGWEIWGPVNGFVEDWDSPTNDYSAIHSYAEVAGLTRADWEQARTDAVELVVSLPMDASSPFAQAGGLGNPFHYSAVTYVDGNSITPGLDLPVSYTTEYVFIRATWTQADGATTGDGIIMANGSRNYLSTWDTGGAFVDSVALSTSPQRELLALGAVGGDGILYGLDNVPVDETLCTFDSTTRSGYATWGTGDEPRTSSNPMQLGVFSDAVFYVRNALSAGGRRVIVQLDTNGDHVRYLGDADYDSGSPWGLESIFSSSGISGIAKDGAGNLFVMDSNRGLVKFTAGTYAHEETFPIHDYTLPVYYADPRRLAIDPATGYIYFHATDGVDGYNYVYCLNGSDWSEIWRSTIQTAYDGQQFTQYGDTPANIMFHGGQIFVGTNNRYLPVEVLDAATGALDRVIGLNGFAEADETAAETGYVWYYQSVCLCPNYMDVDPPAGAGSYFQLV